MNEKASRAKPKGVVGSAPANVESWTVAIYMNADGSSGSSDLDQVAIRELGEIVRTATTRKKGQRNRITVAVQLDLHGIDGMLRMTVEDDGKLKGLFYPEANVAHKDTLEDFFEWVSDACPSERYMVLFWGHSSGPVVLVGDYEVGKPGASVQAPLSAGLSATTVAPALQALGFDGRGVLHRLNRAIGGCRHSL